MEQWTNDKLSVFARLQELNLRQMFEMDTLTKIELKVPLEDAIKALTSSYESLIEPLVSQLEQWNGRYILIIGSAEDSGAQTQKCLFREIQPLTEGLSTSSFLFYPDCFSSHDLFQEWLEGELIKLAEAFEVLYPSKD